MSALCCLLRVSTSWSAAFVANISFFKTASKGPARQVSPRLTRAEFVRERRERFLEVDCRFPRSGIWYSDRVGTEPLVPGGSLGANWVIIAVGTGNRGLKARTELTSLYKPRSFMNRTWPKSTCSLNRHRVLKRSSSGRGRGNPGSRWSSMGILGLGGFTE
jgi:hypothetical protein